MRGSGDSELFFSNTHNMAVRTKRKEKQGVMSLHLEAKLCACLPKGGARYLNGTQLKIKVHCVTPFSASSVMLSTKRSSGHFLSCNLHLQISNSISFDNVQFPLGCYKCQLHLLQFLGLDQKNPNCDWPLCLSSFYAMSKNERMAGTAYEK